MARTLEESKQELIAEINKRVEEKILEESNATLLIKLIDKAENVNEAISIAQLGTTYRRTGLHYDKRLESFSNTIKYLKKNDALSFKCNDEANLNKLIIGDNYDALLNLLITHRNKIDVIYIDPPYASDSMGEFAKTNYNNAITRDNLLSMMYPRLILAKQLLTEEGVIFCSIDDKNLAYLKCLFDDVFGERNFIANIVWQSTGGSNTGESLITVTEYVLMYSKSQKCKIKLLQKNNSKCLEEDEYVATRGKYYLQKLDGTFTRDHYSPSLKYPIMYKDKEIWPGGDKDTNKLYNWRWSRSKVEWGIKNGFIEFVEDKNSNVSVYFKNYEFVDNKDGKRLPSVPPKNVFIGTDKCTTSTGTAQLTEILGYCPFDFPKNTFLIKYLLNLIDLPDNAIVLDFFAGSGTTGQAVLELNRDYNLSYSFILATCNEKTPSTPNGIAYDVTTKRIKRVMTGTCYDGTDEFAWLKKNKPFMSNFDVYEINFVSNMEYMEGKSAFEVIDETCYDIPKFENMQGKVNWVCSNFENTQKSCEDDISWKTRVWGE